MGILPLLLGVIAAVSSAQSTARAIGHADVSLLSETDHPRPGSTFLIGIRIVPGTGWHGYWSNPGDSGIPPVVNWKAPRGLRFGPLLHPAPTLLRVAGVTSYVHTGEHVLLARVRTPSTLKSGTPLPIEGQIVFATCSSSLCVPQRATLQLMLTVGDGAANKSANSVKSALQRLPTKLGTGSFSGRGHAVRMQVPKAANVNPARATFFPSSNEMLAASTLRVRPVRGRLVILGSLISGKARPTISGVLTDGERSYALTFRRSK